MKHREQLYSSKKNIPCIVLGDFIDVNKKFSDHCSSFYLCLKALQPQEYCSYPYHHKDDDLSGVETCFHSTGFVARGGYFYISFLCCNFLLRPLLLNILCVGFSTLVIVSQLRAIFLFTCPSRNTCYEKAKTLHGTHGRKVPDRKVNS
jgi:hypothetical protein